MSRRLYMIDKDPKGRWILFNEQRTMKVTVVSVTYKLEMIGVDGQVTTTRRTVDVRKLKDPLTQRNVATGIASVVDEQIEAGQ